MRDQAPVEDASHPGCAHDRGQIADSRFYGHLYATPASRRIFCDVCRFQRWLDIEAALALSQAELSIISTDHARQIAAAARVEHLQLDGVRDEIRRTRHSLVALLRALQDACEGDAGQWVHLGATTQDIQDTGQALEMRDVMTEIDREMLQLLRTLQALASAHQNTLMLGRTHARPALPLTFGLKVASWLDELLRHMQRLEQAKPRILVAQLYGGVGTMAGFGGSGPELAAVFARRVGLTLPLMGWHVARDRVVEYVGLLAMIAATLARIADELRTLSRPEFGELELEWTYGAVGSSTMPHKRNPEASQQVVVLARLAAGQVPLALQAMVVEHERDSRGLRLEWPIVADVSHYVLAALQITNQITSGVSVDDTAMERHASDGSTAISSEALMLALGEHIGKQSAHEHVYDLSQTAKAAGCTLREAVVQSSLVQTHISAAELEEIFDPRRHLGASSELVADILRSVDATLNGGDPSTLTTL